MILYFFFVGRRIVLTNGFVKKSMKTPKSAVELAVKYKNAHMTQMQLSELTGITQSDISKIENGNGNPSLKTLQKIAHAFGKKLKIEFV